MHMASFLETGAQYHKKREKIENQTDKLLKVKESTSSLKFLALNFFTNLSVLLREGFDLRGAAKIFFEGKLVFSSLNLTLFAIFGFSINLKPSSFPFRTIPEHF